MSKTIFVTPSGVELKLKPLPHIFRLKLAQQGPKALNKRSAKGTSEKRLSAKADIIEAGLDLDLTPEQKRSAQVFLQKFESEEPGVLTGRSEDFVYFFSLMDIEIWESLIDAILELSEISLTEQDSPDTKPKANKSNDPLAGFKRKPKK